jgi:prolyl oligopeptidase
MSSSPPAYPAARREDVTDTYFGGKHTVADPYRWLEDPDSAETQAWVGEQQKVTAAAFSPFAASRSRIRSKLEALYNYGRSSCPMVRGSRAFVYRNTGLQNQDVLFRLQTDAVHTAPSPSPPSPEVADVFAGGEAFMDLNAQFPDGTTALSSTAFSEDGAFFAYGLSRGGSDWVTIYVRDTATGKDLADTVSYVKFSGIKWTHDNKGFFYSRYPAPPEVADTESGKAGTETSANTHAFVAYHALGTPQSEDLLVYANPAQPNWRYGVDLSDDGEYLTLSTVKGTDPVSRLYYAHLPTVWDAWRASAAKAAAVPPGGVPPVQAASQAAAAADASGSSYFYLPFVRVLDNFEAEYDVVANDGERFYLRTNLDAPRYRLVAMDFPRAADPGEPVSAGVPAPAAGATIDIDKPSLPTPPVFEVVPQHAADVLDWIAAVAGNTLLLCYMRSVVNVLQIRRLPAQPPALSGPGAALLLDVTEPVPLPAPGTIASVAGRRDQDTVFLKFVSFLHPGSILRLTFNVAPEDERAAGHGGMKRIALPGPVGAAAAAVPIPMPTPPGGGVGAAALASIGPFWDTTLPGFDASLFEAKQVFVPSEDGSVQIPMFVVHKKGLLSKGPAPLLLYGYGGFNISLPPNFSSLRLTWLRDCDGVFALANIRGGGELGEEWHKGGMRLQKRNCFSDFAQCARWLAREGYTAPRKTAIIGGSNGGLLTLACSLLYPTLFGAAISQVPVADMLRFHKFTIGSAWRGEYGFAEDNEEDFVNMRGYSPLHNVVAPASAEEQLPSILITTADHDDRVVPLHSFKMAATLQHMGGGAGAGTQTRPLLIRIESKAGHGAGKPTSKVLDEYADIYAFAAHETGAVVAE